MALFHIQLGNLTSLILPDHLLPPSLRKKSLEKQDMQDLHQCTEKSEHQHAGPDS